MSVIFLKHNKLGIWYFSMQVVLMQVPSKYSKFGNVIRNIKNKPGDLALESDLKSTMKLLFRFDEFVWISVNDMKAP